MTGDSIHETYMHRCLDLALQGLGLVAPNPLVGAVIMHEGLIIGEGFHHNFGGPHAEVHAVNSVQDKSLLKRSVLYVNLEPCSHTGKTPPCADMIIRCGIPEVVVGSSDPNPLVSGRGLIKLRQAGVKVTEGILKKECIELNRRFFTFHTLKRPYIIMKWAQTSDGFIDVIREKPGIQEPVWISNEISRMLVHKWRSEEQAILVGTQTAVMDNPHLNVREWPGNSPVRLVIDRNLRLPKSLHVFDNNSPTIIFNNIRDLTEGNTKYVRLDAGPDFPVHMLNYLYENGIQSVLVEGGRKIIDSFVQADAWDEARVFKGMLQFGAGVQAPDISGFRAEEYYIRKDLLLLYRNNHGNK